MREAIRQRAKTARMQARDWSVPYFGIPGRMTNALRDVFRRDGMEQHERKIEVIDQILCDETRVPLAHEDGSEIGEAFLFRAAMEAARLCYLRVAQYKTSDAGLAAIGMICRSYGVPLPQGDTTQEQIARAVDKDWWLRNLRKEHARRFEHAAIQLGLTGQYVDPYISRESALRQARRNTANAKLLAKTELSNGVDTYTLAQLSALGVSNKAIRRGELMTRIRGFEEIAVECGHVGQFWTITCPSEFHSVGGTNENYNGATPRDAQAYLVHAWALMRAALHRQGLRVYGFRIAEPHTDGCPHWHMILFVGPTVQPKDWHPPLKTRHIQRTPEQAAQRIARIITLYSRYYAPHEKGAKKNRVKLVRIEAGKGTAAGYIAKYVAKNIDGEGVGDHKTIDGMTVAPDMFGKQEITPSQRVTYWSQTWGIRQFQQIGGAPVGVWRELRRVKAETIQNAPAAIKLAHAACQSIKGGPEIAKQASFADYLRAQGGPLVGRGTAIKIATTQITVEGKYATYEAEKPVGVYAAAQPMAVYESVRYQWVHAGVGGSAADRLRSASGVGVGGAFGGPWTGVNNCTREPDSAPWMQQQYEKKSAFCSARGFRDWRPEETEVRPDRRKVDQFKNHSRSYAERNEGAHLRNLQRKFND